MSYGGYANNYASDYDAWIARHREASRQVAYLCDNCLDDIYEGADVWIAEETDEHGQKVACSVGCVAELAVDNGIDGDEFTKHDAE